MGLKLNTFAAMPCRALGQAVTTMALGVSAVMAAAIFLSAPRLIGLFDTAPDVVAHGTYYLRVCCSVNFLAYAAMYLFDSFSTGVGYPGLAMANALLHAVVVRLGLSWVLGIALGYGFTGFCWAEMPAPFPCAMVGAAFFRAGKWKTKRLA